MSIKHYRGIMKGRMTLGMQERRRWWEFKQSARELRSSTLSFADYWVSKDVRWESGLKVIAIVKNSFGISSTKKGNCEKQLSISFLKLTKYFSTSIGLNISALSYNTERTYLKLRLLRLPKKLNNFQFTSPFNLFSQLVLSFTCNKLC